jgi:hypothetical protein
MRTRLIIAACLACAASTAYAQARIGSSAAGSLGGSGAVTDFGPRPLDPRTPGPAEQRNPPAASAPAITPPPSAPQSSDLAPAAPSRPIVDGAVWGSAPNPTPPPQQ